MARQGWMTRAVMLVLAVGLLFGCGGGKPAGEGTANQPGGAASQSGGAAQSGDAAGQSGNTATGEPLKVGAVFILSGGNAGYGVAQRGGVELAVEEINQAGGIHGRPLEVIFEDSQGQTDEAVNATRKLIDRDEVIAIIGPTLSGEMFSAGKVANDSGVPVLGVSTTAQGITDIGPYVFRNSLPEAGVLPHTVKRSIDSFGLKKVALLWAANDDFSVSGYKTFKEELQKNGVEIVAEASFNTKDTEFGPQITKVMQANPDALVISSLYQEAALFMVQARRAGYQGPFIGGNGFNSPKIAEIAQDAAEGAVVGSPWYAGRDDAKVKQFVEKYQAKMKMGPDQFAAQAYDGIRLIAEALKQGGDDREKVREALAAIKNYEGVTGRFSFDENRNPVMEPYILQIKGGKYVELPK